MDNKVLEQLLATVMADKEITKALIEAVQKIETEKNAGTYVLCVKCKDCSGRYVYHPWVNGTLDSPRMISVKGKEEAENKLKLYKCFNIPVEMVEISQETLGNLSKKLKECCAQIKARISVSCEAITSIEPNIDRNALERRITAAIMGCSGNLLGSGLTSDNKIVKRKCTIAK